jgi:hypothetical protein
VRRQPAGTAHSGSKNWMGSLGGGSVRRPVGLRQMDPARTHSNQESPSCGWKPSRRAVHYVVARGVKMQNLFH